MHVALGCGRRIRTPGTGRANLSWAVVCLPAALFILILISCLNHRQDGPLDQGRRFSATSPDYEPRSPCEQRNSELDVAQDTDAIAVDSDLADRSGSGSGAVISPSAAGTAELHVGSSSIETQSATARRITSGSLGTREQADALPSSSMHKPLQHALLERGRQHDEGGGGGKAKLMLFIGCLSAGAYGDRRSAVREAWLRNAQVTGVSAAKFIFGEDERTTQVQQEVDAHGDVLFMAKKTTYESILHKVYFLFEYAVLTYDVAFILKADDDSFVNVPWLVLALRNMCVTPGCANERLYMGHMSKNSEVLLRPGHKWENTDFVNHTSLRRYPQYAVGGGYILSSDVVSMLLDMQARMGLKFTPIEDAMVGAWLMPLTLRTVDHPRFYARAEPCCFSRPSRWRRIFRRPVEDGQLKAHLQESMCSRNPWLVLHKVETPTRMRILGGKFAECPQPCSQPVAVAKALAAADAVQPSTPVVAEEER